MFYAQDIILVLMWDPDVIGNAVMVSELGMTMLCDRSNEVMIGSWFRSIIG
jgi:hypothetical protein